MRCSVDGRPNRNNKVAFSNLSGIVWTRPLHVTAGGRTNFDSKSQIMLHMKSCGTAFEPTVSYEEKTFSERFRKL